MQVLKLPTAWGGDGALCNLGWLVHHFPCRLADGLDWSPHSFNSYLLVRLAFGDTGARIVNLAFSISLLGWFGINLNLFGRAIAGLSSDVLGVVPPELAVTIGASILITVTTIIGFRAINFVSTLMIPVLMLVALVFLAAVLGQEAGNRLFQNRR